MPESVSEWMGEIVETVVGRILFKEIVPIKNSF